MDFGFRRSVILVSFTVCAVAVGTFLKWIERSDSAHLVNMQELCISEFANLQTSPVESAYVETSSCTLIANSEFMIFEIGRNAGLEMVCYDFPGAPYTLESQRCTFNSRNE